MIRVRKRSSSQENPLSPDSDTPESFLGRDPEEPKDLVVASDGSIKTAALRQLMPHQEKALAFGEGRMHLPLIMEMRTGKTLTAIRWVVIKSYVETILVVAPTTVLLAWEKELSLEGEKWINIAGKSIPQREAMLAEAFCWAEPKSAYDADEDPADRGVGVGRTWVLLNYELLLRMPALTDAPWDVVFLDESTRVKSPSAAITKLVTKGFRKVKHRGILTGLANPENDLEIFCQMKFVYGSFAGCGTYWQYRSKFGRQNDRTGKWDIAPEAKGPLRDLLHRRAFVLSRRQAGMHRKKVYQTRQIEMTPLQHDLYRQAARDFEITLAEDGGTLTTAHEIVVQNWLMKLAGGFDPENNLVSEEPTNEVLRLLDGELRGERVVIWFHYRHELEYVRAQLEGLVPFGSIMGGDSLESRQEAINTLNRHPNGVLLATEQCAKFGIDCSSASTALYYSNDWSNEARSQSEDRILHPNKTDPLLYIDLVTKGTIAEKAIWELQRKSFNARSFMEHANDWLGGLRHGNKKGV
jgi:SNF2 family DNA or RNA helicase